MPAKPFRMYGKQEYTAAGTARDSHPTSLSVFALQMYLINQTKTTFEAHFIA
jgi:hypothetical protein